MEWHHAFRSTSTGRMVESTHGRDLLKFCSFRDVQITVQMGLFDPIHLWIIIIPIMRWSYIVGVYLNGGCTQADHLISIYIMTHSPSRIPACRNWFNLAASDFLLVRPGGWWSPKTHLLGLDTKVWRSWRLLDPDLLSDEKDNELPSGSPFLHISLPKIGIPPMIGFASWTRCVRWILRADNFI